MYDKNEFFIFKRRFMDEKKLIIAQNISALRKANHLTQAELAERLNYSDKAVSKWERGESVPDVLLLSEISEMFGVTLDYFLHTHSPDEKIPEPEEGKRRLHTAITLTSCIAPYFVVILLYFIFDISAGSSAWLWKLFITPLPVVAIILVIFSALWSRRIPLFLSISLLLWSIILTVFVFVMNVRAAWMMFVLGIPLQAVICLWFFLFKKKKKVY